MNAVLFFTHYIVWHYTRAYRDMALLYLNFLWFVAHFFSLPLLIRTLFSPWKRISAGHRKFDFEDWAEAVAFNLMSRVTGFIIRSVLIVIGLIMLAVLTLEYLVVLFTWMFLPFLAAFSMFYGVSLLLL